MKKVELEFAQTNNPSSQVVLSTGGKPVTVAEARNLSEIMLSERNFTTVHLNNSSISPEAFQPLSSGMLGSRSITSIDLSSNYGILGNPGNANGAVTVAGGDDVPQSFKTFLEAVEQNPVTSLNLSHTNTHEKAVEGLAAALNGKPLKFLDLSGNVFLGDHYITSQDSTLRAFGHIADIVCNPNLVSLHLSSMGLKPGGNIILPLAKGLTNHPTLQTLELGGNHFAMEPGQEVPEGFAAIIDAIAPSKTLKHLGLSQTYMNINGFLKILRSFEASNNKTLKSLDVSQNPLWADGAGHMQKDGALISRLKDLLSWKSKSLDSLNISGTFNYGGSVNEIVKAFADALGEKHNIKKLNLSGNALTDKAIMYLIKTLKAGSSLDELDLSNNNITGTSSVMLEQILDSHTTLLLSSSSAELIEPFMGKGDIAELLELRKVLKEVKFPGALAKLIEAYYNDGTSVSGKFVVPGQAREAADADASKEVALGNLLDQMFTGRSSAAVLGYVGGDFTDAQIEVIGAGSSVGSSGDVVVIHT
jgi:Ran GTPase-activating protein (RanGAP) involved in mRNA processing and transport